MHSIHSSIAYIKKGPEHRTLPDTGFMRIMTSGCGRQCSRVCHALPSPARRTRSMPWGGLSPCVATDRRLRRGLYSGSVAALYSGPVLENTGPYGVGSPPLTNVPRAFKPGAGPNECTPPGHRLRRRPARILQRV
jgi:hypothetical protein